MSIILKNKKLFNIKIFYFKCCIGKRGLTSNKKEGDQKTPKGEFGIEKLYYRKDDKILIQELNVFQFQKIWVGVMILKAKSIIIKK